MSDTEMTGKRVAISGAAGGIGHAMAQRFARAGAHLVLIDMNLAALKASAEDLGAAVTLVECDQRHDAQIEAATAAAWPVDVFVNNAGKLVRKPLLDTPFDEISDILATNVDGAIKMAIAMARRMVERKAGTIVNIASQHAFTGAANRGIYGASKAALVQFTKTAAVEWAPLGLRVFAVAPGPVASPMSAVAMQSEDYRRDLLRKMPIDRILESQEIADLVYELSQPRMASVVGHTIVADGGFCLS